MKHFLLLVTALCFALQASASPKGPISVSASVIDISNSRKEVQKQTSYAVCFSHLNMEEFTMQTLKLLKEFPTALNIRFSSPVEPCGEEMSMEFNFEKRSKIGTVKNESRFNISTHQKAPMWFRITITTEVPLMSSVHEEVFKSILMSGKKYLGEPDNFEPVSIKVGTFTTLSSTIGSQNFIDFLMYTSYRHSISENEVKEFTFHYTADKVNRGTVVVSTVTWDPSGPHRMTHKTLQWHLGPELQLIITQEDETEIELELHQSPDVNDGTINPLDFDDTFPTFWFDFEGTRFVSESMAAC